MKVYNSLLVLSLLITAPFISEAATSKGKSTRCPSFIGNVKTKTFFKIPSNFVCSSKSLKIKALKESDILTKGAYEFLPEFDMAGQGQANTPAFQVGKSPAVITYSVNDPSDKANFRISVVNIVTRKVVEVLTNSKGTVSDATTYSHNKGGFYLRIDAEATVRVCTGTPSVCTTEPVDWEVRLN